MRCKYIVNASVADPDPAFHSDADPDPDPTFQFDAYRVHSLFLQIWPLQCPKMTL